MHISKNLKSVLARAPVLFIFPPKYHIMSPSLENHQ